MVDENVFVKNFIITIPDIKIKCYTTRARAISYAFDILYVVLQEFLYKHKR